MSIYVRITNPAQPVAVTVVQEEPEQFVRVTTPLIETLQRFGLSDYVAPYNYIGRAYIGTNEDVANWNISRIEISTEGEVDIKHAYNVKWTDRLIVIYS